MTHADAVTSLATGFEGQLFGWWTHTMSSSARETIINHTKEIITTTNPSTTFTPSTSATTTTTSQPDGIDVLYYTILMHFVGNPNRFQGKEFSKLQNLKCKKLNDFKWYKDVFLTRVLQRPDNANSYWKEKFISGLPTLFSTKVRDKMVEQMASSDWSQIDLNTWTYGLWPALEDAALANEAEAVVAEARAFNPTFQTYLKIFSPLTYQLTYLYLSVLPPHPNPITKTKWWDKYGPTINILPPNVKEGYQYWISHFDKPSVWDFIPDLLIYFKQFSLTWILMLEYAIMDKLIGNINVPYFGRQIKIKWWSGMNIADLGTQRVASWFNENPTLCKTLVDQSPFLMAKSQSRAQLAAANSRLATASTPEELRLIAKDMNKAMSTISSQIETGSSGKDDRDFSDDDDTTRFFCHDESESQHLRSYQVHKTYPILPLLLPSKQYVGRT
ncbi:hypothetical protein Dsin_009202 [Dipteronia sinensis]|uniref:Uncharacterized protein n=1 Tax=Dipteronia sinensis TaxID=43782 RepID=A0AAE0ARC8_9ROSI|nr:hypothetical protein Dsin_009202 [Dipteronia sinensis]